MQAMSAGIRWCFESMDRARRERGVRMDQAGLGPVESRSETLLSTPGLRLRYYGGALAGGPVALIIPAPIKRHYIWDLSPERSVVQRALAQGLPVYLVEWTRPDANLAHFGLDEYAHALIDRCVELIRTRHRPAHIFLLSHSLGGVLAAIYAALQPQYVAGLVLIETPLHFAEASGSFQPLLALGPPATRMTEVFDTVPGSVISLASVSASPATFHTERVADFVASMGSNAAMRSHLQVERWTLDEAPMAGRLFEQVVDQLYREDRLMRGSLVVAGRMVAPADVTAPLLAVYDPQSRIIPPAAVIAFHDAAASTIKRLLRYDGDTGVALLHVGALIGDNAHRLIWPEIFRWMAATVQH